MYKKDLDKEQDRNSCTVTGQLLGRAHGGESDTVNPLGTVPTGNPDKAISLSVCFLLGQPEVRPALSMHSDPRNTFSLLAIATIPWDCMRVFNLNPSKTKDFWTVAVHNPFRDV